MFTNVYRLAIALFLVTVVSSCGTTTGNYGVALLVQGTAPGSLTSLITRAFGVTSGRSVSVTALNKDGSTGGTLTLTDARLALKEIRFRSSGGETGDVKLQGPFIVDLLSNTVSPALDTIDLTAGLYTGFEMKLAKVESGIEATDTLFGRSIYLEGTYSGPTGNSGTVANVPFTLAFEIDEEFALPDGVQGFQVADNTLSTVIIAFRMARWLAFNSSANDKPEDLSDVQVSSGRIDLSDSSPSTNKNIWEVIRKLVKDSADFGKDSDGDGKLESSEDEDDSSNDGLDD